jgi:glycerophosphoryl diester phosphodiesterase
VKRPLIIAHRGASRREPENSLAAFRAAGPAGADGVELDVHATADGAIVVHHDEVIKGHVHIAHASAKQVREQKLPNGEPIPLLAEALASVPPGLFVFVEVKALAATFDDGLFRIIDQSPAPERCAIHSFDHRIIRRLGSKRPALRRGVLSSSYLVRPIAALEDADASVLWQERSVVDQELAESVHTAGLQVYAWVVNDRRDMDRMLGWGIDALCTDLPELGREAVQGMTP